MDNLTPETITIEQLKARVEETERQIAIILEKLHKDTGIGSMRIEAEPMYIRSNLVGSKSTFSHCHVSLMAQLPRLK